MDQSFQKAPKTMPTYTLTTGKGAPIEPVIYPINQVSQPIPNHLVDLANRKDWSEIESRHAYMESCVEQDIAWQISINRKSRELTQKQLAKIIGTTQTAIARWEDSCYGRHSIPSLVKIANAFDCALIVRLVPYSKLAEITKDTSNAAFLALSYDSETKELLSHD